MEDKFESLRRCYALLVATELGTPPAWLGPCNGADLRGRTECLALSLGVLPQHQRAYLDVVANGISRAFPDESLVGIARLKAAASAELSKLSASVTSNASRSTRIDGPHHSAIDHPAIGQLQTAMNVWRKRLDDRFRCDCCIPRGALRSVGAEDWVGGERLYYRADDHNRVENASLETTRLLETLPTILEKTVGPCLMVAGPGEGKTFAIDHLIETMLGDAQGSLGLQNNLEIPVLVDGAAYGEALSKEESITPLEFFFRSLEIQDLDASQAAAAFRTHRTFPKRGFLIIDRWEEIPESLRCVARRNLDQDSHGIVALVSSRGIGSEWSVGSHRAGKCFRMASISGDDAVRQAHQFLGTKTSGVGFKKSVVENAVGRVVSTPEFRSLSRNPYWMSQLCSVLAAEGASNSEMSFPAPTLVPHVAEKLLALERKRLNQIRSSGGRLELSHFKALGQIAYNQWVSPNFQPSKFSQFECEVATERLGIQPGPIFQSRLVSRLDSGLDEYQFVDPLFQNYFAAQHLIEAFGPAAHRDFFDQAMRCPRLLGVVCNAVGFDPGFREICRDGLADWVGQSDHFGLIIERSAWVATAAHFSIENLDGPVPEIRRRLWDAIQSPIRPCVVERFVPTLAMLDPQFLINKLRAQKRSGSPLIPWICEFVPPAIAENLRPSVTSKPFCGRSPEQLSPAHANASCENISRKNIDANLRRIAGLRPDHPQIAKHLSALLGQSISANIDVVVQVARCPQADSSVRSLAIGVLAESPLSLNREVMEELLKVNADLPQVTSLLRIARRQNAKLEEGFLDNRLALDSTLNEKKQLIEGFLKGVLDRTARSCTQASKWISRRILIAVDRRDFDLLNVICECITAEDCRQVVQWLDPQVDDMVTDALVRFINHPKETSFELVRVAVKLVTFRANEADSIHLLQALERALSCSQSKRSCAKVAQFESLSRDLAIALVYREPAALMNRVWDHPIVQKVLAESACERNWLVYREQIISADGFVIAKNSNDPLAHLRFSTPEVVQEIARQLSPRQRNDFLGYWYVVSEGGEDYVTTDRETVHQAMCVILASDVNTSLSERLMMCYRDESPPKYSTWKKNLARVVDRCSDRPEWMAHLKKIGLAKQRGNRSSDGG